MVGRFEAQGSDKLPSQAVINPKENVSAITLKGDKQLEKVHKSVIETSNEKSEKRNLLGILNEASSLIKVGKPPKKMPITKV